MTDNKTDTIAQVLRDSIQMTDALIEKAQANQQADVVPELLSQRRGLVQGLLELSCWDVIAKLKI